MPPVKELTQCMSYPGGLADSDESRNGYQRIGVIGKVICTLIPSVTDTAKWSKGQWHVRVPLSVGDDSLVNLSMHHVVLRNKRAEHSTT